MMMICGHVGNESGQLCNGNKEDCLIPQKISFANILKTSAGNFHSLFQNVKGVIFANVVLIKEHVDWVIIILLKLYQVSFPMHIQTLFNLFADIGKVYFLIQKVSLPNDVSPIPNLPNWDVRFR